MKYGYHIILSISILSMLLSCSDSQYMMPETRGTVRQESNVSRKETDKAKRVLLYYAAGYNNLCDNLREDIGLLAEGYLPGPWKGDAVLLVFSNLAASEYDYSDPAIPVLEKIYRNFNGDTVRDTLLKLPAGSLAASAGTMKTVLEYVKDNFPAYEYGMIFSSHATGWLPAKNKDAGISPLSIGNEYRPGSRLEWEMDLPDFAEAIPMQLDFILFDACLMGGVEVAFELKEKCRYVAFSQTEVLADGFDYRCMGELLLKPVNYDLAGVCRAYFDYYDIQSGQMRSATVSMIDTGKTGKLADVCGRIFESHRSELDGIDPRQVQCFGRSPSHRFFYDLEDMTGKLSLSETERKEFTEALKQCVIYKASTEYFVELGIKHFCGLSSYMPNLRKHDTFYKSLKWNKATGMIR